jgi:hypothetical protein
MSDITSRRGRVLGMDSDEGSSGIQVVRATFLKLKCSDTAQTFVL